VLNVEDPPVGRFDDETALPGALRRYVAMALNILDMLVVERYTTNQRVSGTCARRSRAINSIRSAVDH